MPQPAELIALARLLVSPGTAGKPSDAQLRRAVSTAYYAVFHKVLRSAADRFIGPGRDRSAGYGVLYRGFNHGRIRSVCESLNSPNLSKTVQEQLGRGAVSQDMREFAGHFTVLQYKRHRADYDPSAVFGLIDSEALVDAAETAIATFDIITPDEKADVLALMLVNPRG